MLKKKKQKTNRFLKIIARIAMVLLLLFFIVVLLVRSPWGQDIIVSKVLDYVTGKTGTKVTLDRLFITFSGGISVEGLYLEDQKGDTLVYSKGLEASVGLIPLIRGKEFNLKKLEWSGLRANISRNESNAAFNFDFLIDAFAPADSVQVKDTTAESMKIVVGNIDLEDIHLKYKDNLLGITNDLDLGNLQLDMDELDLESMKFRIGDFRLSKSHITYEQSKPFETDSDTTSTGPLPYLEVDNFQISDVGLQYESIPDSIRARIKLGDLLIELPKADLEGHTIELGKVQLHNSDIQYISSSVPKKEIIDTTQPKPITFEWPDWKVKVDEIDFIKNHLDYQQGKITDTVGLFNPSHLQLQNVTLKVEDLSLDDKEAKLKLNNFSFVERSGMALRNFAFDLQVDHKVATLSNLDISTNNSIVQGKITLNYPSLNRFLNSPEQVSLEVDLPKISLNAEDSYFFEPKLRDNPYVKAFSEKKLIGLLKAEGTLADIKLENMALHWGDSTSLKIAGSLKNVTNSEGLQYDIRNLHFQTDSTDIYRFISKKELGLSLPKTVALNGILKGGHNEISSNIQLKTPQGDIHVEGSFSDKETLVFDAQLKVEKLQLAQLLQNEKLGPLSFTTKISGNGESVNTLDATLSSNFNELTYGSYDFSNLRLDGELIHGKGETNLVFKDHNLDLDTKVRMQLDSVAPEFNMVLDLKGADLAALGVTQREIRTKFKLTLDFKGNSDNLDLTSTIMDGMAVYNDNPYPLGNLKTEANVRKDSTRLKIKSDILDLDLKSNRSPTALTEALKRHFNNYISDTVYSDTLRPSATMQIDLALHNQPILRDVFLEGLEKMDSVSLKASFDEADHQIAVDLNAQHIKYNTNQLDSLHLDINGDKEDLKFFLGWQGLAVGPLSIPKISLNGTMEHNNLIMDFDAFSQNENLVHVRSQWEKKGDSIRFHIDPDGLVLNKEPWSIPSDNYMILAKKHLAFSDFILSHQEEKFTLSTDMPGIDTEHTGLIFKNFELATFLSFLNPDKEFAQGSVNGQVILENIYREIGLLADLSIQDLQVMEVPLGKFSLITESENAKNYSLGMSLKGKNVDLGLQGEYVAAQSGPTMYLNFVLRHLDLKTLEGFLDTSISETEGSISGKAKISGTTTDPTYSGSFKFNGASTIVKAVNSRFTLPDEEIKLDNDGLYFDNFTVVDSDKDKFQLDGMVLTKDLTNPSFDLTLNAENFQVVNSSKDDNDLFYGKINIDADLSISGNLSIPKIDGEFEVNQGSDFTFVVPEDQVAITEKEGVVIFVNKENPDDILTRNKEDEVSASILKGYDIDVTLSVDESSIFKVVIDERAGDNFQISGKGDFQLGVEPNGRTTLTGKYEVNDGFYEAGLYNLVKKKFDIAKGSTITWNGNPMDATLDIRAIYKVETSASPLMAYKTSGQSAQTSQKFRQKLPFLVYLDVDGVLLKPEISFELDMPEDKQGELGGEVYGRVEQLNEQKDELNKQVFSLLALNQFFPASGSDGSSGGAASIARDNVNDVLSGQLNTISDKLMGNTGVELDFGLNSYTDYQGASPQNRTQLDINARKRLFNDRLIVQVGSEVDIHGSNPNTDESTPMIGNVSLEYLLTDNGKFRLKGFRQNEYESVIDGQLIVTGIALIFNKEFNKFKDLWAKEIKEEADKQKKGKKD